MASTQYTNAVFTGASDRKSLYDLTIPSNWNGKLIVFIHGYMGFKDWGCWHLVGSYFVENSYGFLKYNVSHNGGTIEQLIDFPDPDAFSRNTYSKEVEDFECVVQEAFRMIGSECEVFVIGHSRGGGIAALQAHQPYVKKWCSWAGISSIASRFPIGEVLEEWRHNTYRYVKNGRTLQELPLHFDQYLDFKANADRLDIRAHCEANTKPCLIFHGTDDTSVLPFEAENLAEWTGTHAVMIQGAQHTFNASHPWNEEKMPDALAEICRKTFLFFEA